MKIGVSYRGMAIVLFYGFDLLYLCLMHLLPSNEVAKAISTIVLYLLVLMAISKSKRIIKRDAVMCILINGLVFLLTYMSHPEYGHAMFTLPTWNIWDSVFTLTSGMFGFFFFRMEESSENLKRYLKYMAYVLFVWGCLRVVSSIQNGGFSRISANGNVLTDSYDMSVGYRFLFCAIVFFVQFWSEQAMKRWYFAMLSILSVALMMVFGSRTAVVSFVLFLILYVLFFNDGRNKTRQLVVRVLFLLLFGGGYWVLTTESALLMLSSMLSKYGFNSRMLNTLIAGSVVLDNGRNKLWTIVIEMIKQHPLLGNGVYADRYVGGIYCHQIVLELWLDFGIVLGTFFLLLLIKGSIEMLVKCRDKNWKLIFMVFFSMAAIRLNLSSSFWCDTNFWICIAIYVNYKTDLRKQRALSEKRIA